MQNPTDTSGPLSNGLHAGAVPASEPTGSSPILQTAGELQNLLADVEDLLKESAVLTGTELGRIRVRILERLVAARASLGQAASTAAERVRHSAVATNEYVHRQPWPMIGASAAVGLLAGVLLARRNKG